MKKLEVFFCMNREDLEGNPLVKKLYGPDDAFKHRHLEIVYKPCTPDLQPEEKHTVKVKNTDQNDENIDKTSNSTSIKKKENSDSQKKPKVRNFETQSENVCMSDHKDLNMA